jgi:hypothetical protein
MDAESIVAMTRIVFENASRLETLMYSNDTGFSSNVNHPYYILLYRCLVEHNLLVEQLSCCPYYSGFIKKGNKQLLEYGACSVIPRSEYERTKVQYVTTPDSAKHNLEVRQGHCNRMLRQFIINISIARGYTAGVATVQQSAIEAYDSLQKPANRTWFDLMSSGLTAEQIELLRYFGAELKPLPLSSNNPLYFFIPEVTKDTGEAEAEDEDEDEDEGEAAKAKAALVEALDEDATSVYRDDTFNVLDAKRKKGAKVAAHLKPVKAQTSVYVAARNKYEAFYGETTTNVIFRHIHAFLTTIYTGTKINAATDLTLGQCYSCVVPEVGVKISNICLSSCMAAAISIVEECFSEDRSKFEPVRVANAAHATIPTGDQLITDLITHLNSSSFVLIPISLVSYVPKIRTNMAEVFKSGEIYRLLERIDVGMMQERIDRLRASTFVSERERVRRTAAEVVFRLASDKDKPDEDFKDVPLTDKEIDEKSRKEAALQKFIRTVRTVIKTKDKRPANSNLEPSENPEEERRVAFIKATAEEELIHEEISIVSDVVREEMKTQTLTPFVPDENNLNMLFKEQKNMVVIDENNLNIGGKTLTEEVHDTIMLPLMTRETVFEGVCETLLIYATDTTLQRGPYRFFSPEHILSKCTELKSQVFDSSALTREIIADVKNPLLSTYSEKELDKDTFYKVVASDFFQEIEKDYRTVFYYLIGAIYTLPATLLLNSLTEKGMNDYCTELGKVTAAGSMIKYGHIIPVYINPYDILNSDIFKLFLINYFLNYKFYLKSDKTAQLRSNEKDEFIGYMQEKGILTQRIGRTYSMNVAYALDSAVFIIQSLNEKIFKANGKLFGGSSKKILNTRGKSKKFLKKYKNTKKNRKNRKIKTEKITNIKVNKSRRRQI